MKNSSLLELELQLVTLLAGLQTKLAATGTYTVAGHPYTRDELAKTTEESLGLFKSAREAWAAARRKAHERDRRTPDVRLFLQELHSMLNTQFGSESEELLSFGFTPKKRPNRAGPSDAAKPEEKKPGA